MQRMPLHPLHFFRGLDVRPAPISRSCLNLTSQRVAEIMRLEPAFQYSIHKYISQQLLPPNVSQCVEREGFAREETKRTVKEKTAGGIATKNTKKHEKGKSEIFVPFCVFCGHQKSSPFPPFPHVQSFFFLAQFFVFRFGNELTFVLTCFKVPPGGRNLLRKGIFS